MNSGKKLLAIERSTKSAARVRVGQTMP